MKSSVLQLETQTGPCNKTKLITKYNDLCAIRQCLKMKWIKYQLFFVSINYPMRPRALTLAVESGILYNITKEALALFTTRKEYYWFKNLLTLI